MLRARTVKILLQQYLPGGDLSRCSNVPELRLLDHLLGAGEQRGRHLEAERFGSLEIDDQLVLGRCLHRQVGRLFAFENTINISGGSPLWLDQFRPIGNEAASLYKVAERVDGGQIVPGRDVGEHMGMVSAETTCCHNQPSVRVACECSNGTLNFIGVAKVNCI